MLTMNVRQQLEMDMAAFKDSFLYLLCIHFNSYEF